MINFDRLPPHSLPRRTKKNVVIGCAVVLLGALLFHFFAGGDKQKKPPAPGVVVATAEKHDVPVLVSAIGTVIANATVQVSARIEGPIVAIGFVEGQFVKKGDLLFQIERANYEAAARAAAANLQRDEATLVNAQLTLKRSNELAKAGGVSQQVRDTALADAKTAAAAVAASQAALDQANLNLSYTSIRSPVDGKTGAYLVDIGNVVRPSTSSAQTALVVVTQVQPVKISFSLPQTYLPQLQKRLAEKALAISFSETPETKPVTAPVDFINNAVNVTAGTVELRGTYTNEALKLVPGQFLNVAVRIDLLKNATTIPHEAVNTGPDHPYAYVVDAENKIEMRPLTVLYQDNNIAAVTGVKPGERVVRDGQMDVTDGMTIKILAMEPKS